MSRIESVFFDYPYYQSDETNFSKALRATTAALGALSILSCCLIVCLSSPNHFHKVILWSAFSLGILFIGAALSVKCIQNKDELRIKQFWEENFHNAVLRHGTHSIYLHHFQTYGISHTYPQPLCELILKINLIWEKHTPYTMTGYFFDAVHRINKARDNQAICISFSTNENVTQEFTTGARRGGEWVRETRIFLREMSLIWEKLDPEEKETVKKLEALLFLINKLPPMVISFFRYYEPHYSSYETFLRYVKHREGDVEELFHSIKQDLSSKRDNGYEYTVTYPVEAKKLTFTILDQKRLECFSGPFLELGIPTLLTSNEVMQHRILINGFSELSHYRNSRFVIKKVDNSILVTRRLLIQTDHEDLTEEMQKRKRMQQWIETFQCHNLAEKYL